jgi:hypothetical protein
LTSLLLAILFARSETLVVDCVTGWGRFLCWLRWGTPQALRIGVSNVLITVPDASLQRQLACVSS